MDTQDTEAVKKELRRLVSTVYDRVAVLASNEEDGQHYVDILGLEDYVLVTSLSKAQGLRFKLFLITPGFVKHIREGSMYANQLLEAMNRNLAMTGGPIG